MKLYYWKGHQGIKNFGDEINNFLWPKLIPREVYDKSSNELVGIGTILNDQIPKSSNILIFGAGIGYGKPPKNTDLWKIYCVRGPLTAKLLGIDNKCFITDPAILIQKIISGQTEQKHKVGFMPHWRNANHVWEKACFESGFLYINPRLEVEEVVKKIQTVGLLITEAMHGAIVADAYRIPWIPVSDSKNYAHCPFKWMDWTLSMGLMYEPYPIPHFEEKDDNNGDHIQGIKIMKKISKKNPTLSKSKVLRSNFELLTERLDELIHDLEISH